MKQMVVSPPTLPPNPDRQDDIVLERLVRALDACHALVWLSARGEIRNANGRAAALLGRRTDELKGQSLADLTHADAEDADIAMFRHRWPDVVAGRRSAEHRLLQSPDGSGLPCHICYTPIRPDTGPLRTVLAILTEAPDVPTRQPQLVAVEDPAPVSDLSSYAAFRRTNPAQSKTGLQPTGPKRPPKTM